MIYKINPVPKPRMTRGSVHSAPAKRYWAYKNIILANSVPVSKSGDHIIFHVQMPKSWTKKKKELMKGMPHQQKPDLDNFLKALWDAAKKDDSGIWHVRAEKRWSITGAIEIIQSTIKI